ncbi:NUDIX domain-containing protein [Candidatus Woesearchaeota archaeon]|nr:NUDIX domain-containing protein [Candidatus Woesearchaeota archaeon]
MGKEEEYKRPIMVVPTDILFVNNSQFQGFKPHSELEDYESRIIEYKKFMPRGEAEKNFEHKQPIGYAVIVNPVTKKIYCYQRAGNEERLSNKWSIGIGGHIDKGEDAEDNPIHSSLIREMDEEVIINGSQNIKVIGYINDEEEEVGRVHFGILYLVETDSDDVFVNESRLINSKMMTLEEIKKIKDSPDSVLEDWSEIALEAVENYLK